jgi:hypothetical protein
MADRTVIRVWNYKLLHSSDFEAPRQRAQAIREELIGVRSSAGIGRGARLKISNESAARRFRHGGDAVPLIKTTRAVTSTKPERRHGVAAVCYR